MNCSMIDSCMKMVKSYSCPSSCNRAWPSKLIIYSKWSMDFWRNSELELPRLFPSCCSWCSCWLWPCRLQWHALITRRSLGIVISLQRLWMAYNISSTCLICCYGEETMVVKSRSCYWFDSVIYWDGSTRSHCCLSWHNCRYQRPCRRFDLG